MATHALPAAHILDDDAPGAASCKPSLMRRMFDAIVEAQRRRAQREIARILGPRALRTAPGDALQPRR